MRSPHAIAMIGVVITLGLLLLGLSSAKPLCSQPEPLPICDPCDQLPNLEPGDTPLTSVPRWMHQGKPLFVIGVFDYPEYDSIDAAEQPNRELTDKALAELARAGFNTVYTDLHTLTNTDLDRMEMYGMHAIGRAWNWKFLDELGHELNWVRESSQHVAGSALDQKIQEVKDKEAFLAYDSHDEMGWNKEGLGQIAYLTDSNIDWQTTNRQRARVPSLQQAVSFRTFVNSRDPAHPVFYTEVAAIGENGRSDFTPAQFRAWQTAANAWAQDNYPLGLVGEFPSVSLTSVGSTVDAMRFLYDDTGPILMVLQGQGYNDCCYKWGPPHDNRRGRRPNFVEQRFMAFTSVIHGVSGVLWWGTGDLELDSVAWQDIKQVASQLRYLEPALNSTDERYDFTLSSGLEGIQRRVGQRNYLIVANRTSEPISGRICPGTWRVSPTVRVLFEGMRTVAYDHTPLYCSWFNSLQGGWSDSFGPYEVHIYTDSPLTHQKDDFDGDGISDPSWYWTSPAPPALGLFTVLASSMPRLMWFSGGENDDVPLTGDYDGDGITDFALYKARSKANDWGGFFSVWLSESQVWRWFTLGQPGDTPVVADYDGDGVSDFAVYHRYTSPVYDSRLGNLVYGEFQWKSSLYGDMRIFPVGEPDDVPVVGDFDRDGKDDFALYKRRASDNTWGGWFTVWSSASQAWQWVTMGQPGDLPVIGDYDGDGLSDFGVYTPRWPANNGGGYYTILCSSNGAKAVESIGEPDDVPVTGDYDGDGKTDIAVYKRRASNGDWGGWYTIHYCSPCAGRYSWPGRPSVRPGEMPAGREWQQ